MKTNFKNKKSHNNIFNKPFDFSILGILKDWMINLIVVLTSRSIKYSEHWKVSRMSRIDRNILRLALYELLNLSNIPHPVTINEAVEIAKKYGTNESGSFINGIIDRVRVDIDKGEIL